MFKKYKKIIFIILFIGLTIFSITWSPEDEKQEVKEVIKENKIQKEEKKEEKNKVKVDIKGEVAVPGVYELTEENNVNDAIALAGGLTQKSDTSNINLSKKLKDEMVIIIYSKIEIEKMKKEKEIVCPKVNNACITEKDEQAKLETKTEETQSKININEASIEELMKLEGIGQSKAKAIIEYRETNGKFNNMEDIKKVPGIGENAFDKIKDKISI